MSSFLPVASRAVQGGALGLAVVFAFSGCSKPPQVGAKNYQVRQGLETAISARRGDWLESAARLAERHHETGELNDEQFAAMLESINHVLKPGGLFFCRLASNIGMESRMVQRRGRRHLLPDGSERYLVDEALLMEWTARLGGRLADPLKTTIVQDQRCMTTWVVRKS